MCEMSAGFLALRDVLPMNMRLVKEPVEWSRVQKRVGRQVERDVARLCEVWKETRLEFGGGGVFLFGDEPCLADAWFTPTALRLKAYSWEVEDEVVREYLDALVSQACVGEWMEAALEESEVIDNFEWQDGAVPVPLDAME